jgi:hypothetical protein
MKNNIQSAIKYLKNNSTKKAENFPLIEKYIRESFINGTPITFYNWECPPRFIDYKDGRAFLNFNVDLNDIFQGKKIDKFTELPRVVAAREREIKILNALKKNGLKFRFVKLIADTNAIYLTPESMAILGEKKIEAKFDEFKKLLLKNTARYPLAVKVYRFSELIRPFKNAYEINFQSALKLLRRSPKNLVQVGIFKDQLGRVKEHVGLSGGNSLQEFCLRTIASYGAEGIIFSRLAKTKKFSNCVWLNIEEADDRTIAITNCLRQKSNLGQLPMFFGEAVDADTVYYRG